MDAGLPLAYKLQKPSKPGKKCNVSLLGVGLANVALANGRETR